jgi:hypothetical protein
MSLHVLSYKFSMFEHRRRLEEANQNAAREKADWLRQKEQLISGWIKYIDEFASGIVRGAPPQ